MFSRILGRATVVAALATTAVAALAAPALAHTEIELTPAQAGAKNVTMKVTAEAESSKAGIKSVRIVLPAGITASQVTLEAGPSGWSLAPAEDGFTVAGAALKTKTDAEFTVKIAQLPADQTTLTFKTLVTYGNGDVDRWIGAPSDSNPAPVVNLAPAPSPSPSPSPSPAFPSSAPTASPATAAANSSSSGTGWIVAAVIAVLLVAGAVVWLSRRRRTQPPAA